MKTKFAEYKNSVLPRIKTYTKKGSANDKEAAMVLAYTVEFQNLLVEGVSAKFESVEKDVKGLTASLNNVESRLSPLETTVKKLNEESLPEVRTQMRALSTEVRDVSGSVQNALTSANGAKELAESVRQELETHVSSDETAKKLTTITKALDDVGQELRALAQKVASIPSAIPMDLGAVEEMIKNELKKLGFLPAGLVAVQKDVKKTVSGEQARLDAAVSNLENELTLAYTDSGLPSPLLNSEDALEARLQSIEKGMGILIADSLELPWDYVPKSTFEERVEDLKQGMKQLKEFVELEK